MWRASQCKVCYDRYVAFNRLRYNGTGNGNGVYWYSFDEGGVHAVVFSSEHDWREGTRLYQWLEADLAQVNRSVTPWVVLATHRMMYTTQLKEEGDYKVFRYILTGLVLTFSRSHWACVSTLSLCSSSIASIFSSSGISTLTSGLVLCK